MKSLLITCDEHQYLNLPKQINANTVTYYHDGEHGEHMIWNLLCVCCCFCTHNGCTVFSCLASCIAAGENVCIIPKTQSIKGYPKLIKRHILENALCAFVTVVVT